MRYVNPRFTYLLTYLAYVNSTHWRTFRVAVQRASWKCLSETRSSVSLALAKHLVNSLCSITASELHQFEVSLLRYLPLYSFVAAYCPLSTIPLPFFRCHFAVPVSRCRFRTPLPLPLPQPFRISMELCVGSSASMIGWPAIRNNGKIESILFQRKQLSAVYGCNGTEFSYVIFTEQQNFTTEERRNGNGRTATE